MKSVVKFLLGFMVMVCSCLVGCAISSYYNGKVEPPTTYTVKTQTEIYSGLKYDYSHEGRSIFFDKDNKKHVFSGNFQYIQE